MPNSLPRISLGEGNTPLIRSRSLGPSAGIQHLFFKVESANPTGSYKDRFAAHAIQEMRERGDHTCLATSSGNTGAALAAYCAAAGIRCRIAVVETAPDEKLAQMQSYGAEIVKVRGFGTDPDITTQVMESLREKSLQEGHRLQISAYRYSPVGMSGVESIATEISKQSPEPVDHIFSPAGGGGLTLAVTRGADKCTAVHCVQPEGNDTIAGPLRTGEVKARSVNCTTSISGLQVANVIDGDEVITACRKSGGTGHLVTDEAIYEAQKRLAREEGIFSEPAGAVALAGILQAVAIGEIDPASTIVALVTGSGFKDSLSIERINQDASCPVVDVEDLFE